MTECGFSFDDGKEIIVECDIELVANDKGSYSVYTFKDGKSFVLEFQRKELFEYVRGNYK